MWRVTGLLTILALVIYVDAIPKKYHGIPLQTSRSTKAVIDRLPHSALPKNYKIDLIVTEDNIKNGNFSGTATISLTLTESINNFFIDAKFIDVVDVTFSGSSYNGTTTTDGYIHILSSDKFEPGDYTLTVLYNGQLSSTDMDGFYQSTYLDDSGKTHYLATTQFEEFGASRAFPCFDEPEFKATFDISITISDGYNALSNTEIAKNETLTDGTTKVTFRTTPTMSTYLVAFIVSEFKCVDGGATENGVPTKVCGRDSTQSTMTLALATAPKALDQMQNYTGIDYKDMNVGKMTQAAIPDFALGAMENWGMVTYREVDLFWDPLESSNYYKQTVVTVITHEFSHQWFGDKVTLDWWSDIFLNEGFATYFEYHAAQNIDIAKDWELTKQFVVEQLQTVLVSDSVSSSLPLSYETNDPDLIISRFNDISYNKGGSILRMTHHLLGLDNFKKGLTTYLNNIGLIGTPDGLWNTLNANQPAEEPEKLPDTLLRVMENWTKKAGYPLLKLAFDSESQNITITQERFLISGENTDKTEWYVPITFTKSNDTPNFANTATQAWLIPGKELTLTLDGLDWIILNNQQVGYYRVDYDDALLAKISAVLNSDNLQTIDEISRSQIVDDQLNFARAGKKDYGDVLELLGFLKSETSYYTWYSVFSGVSYLLQRTSNEKVKQALNAYILEQMAAVLKQVPVTTEDSTNQIYTLKQVLANTWACKLGDEACNADAKAKFAAFTADATKKVSPNFRSFVYCYGLRNSDNAQNDFDFLYNQYNTSNLATEKLTILKALGCVDDSAIRREFLSKALTGEVRLQDARYVFSSVYSIGPEGVDDVLWFILEAERYKDFEKHFGTKSTLNSLILTLANQFTTSIQNSALISFVQLATDVETSFKEACQDAIQLAKNNLVIVDKLDTSLATHFGLDDDEDNDNGAAVTNSYHIVNLALLLVVYLIFNC